MWTQWTAPGRSVARIGLVAAAWLLFPACSTSETEGEGRQSEVASAALESDTEEFVDIPSLERLKRRFVGDLPEIRERRLLRVLVSYSKTNFFHDLGRPVGFEVEMMGQYEKKLNESTPGNLERTRVAFIPTPFDRLLEDLADGKGDVAAAGLTITAERQELVAFTDPYILRVSEVLVTSESAPSLSSLENLGGKRVVVRAASSYAESLRELSERLESSRGRAIVVVEVDSRLVTEDLLELVSAGSIDFTVADHHIAQAWADVLPGLVVRADLELSTGGDIAWAVRKDSPRLLESLNEFIRANRKGSLMGNILFKRYYSKSKWIRNPVAESERAKLEKMTGLFQKYAAQYDIHWLALAAQAYQESGLDQSRRSGAGAVGVMQLLPTTAADKNVGIGNIEELENNIHAGTKYLAFLRERYFSDPQMDPAARVDFAWAAYNAGPSRINRLRKQAAERGLDPDRWFFHVEKLAAETIGRETVDYVANINKYYLAYRLQYEEQKRRADELSRFGD